MMQTIPRDNGGITVSSGREKGALSPGKRPHIIFRNREKKRENFRYPEGRLLSQMKESKNLSVASIIISCARGGALLLRPANSLLSGQKGRGMHRRNRHLFSGKRGGESAFTAGERRPLSPQREKEGLSCLSSSRKRKGTSTNPLNFGEGEGKEESPRHGRGGPAGFSPMGKLDYLSIGKKGGEPPKRSTILKKRGKRRTI